MSPGQSLLCFKAIANAFNSGKMILEARDRPKKIIKKGIWEKKPT